MEPKFISISGGSYYALERGNIGGRRDDRPRGVWHTEFMGSDKRVHTFVTCMSCGEVNDITTELTQIGNTILASFYCFECEHPHGIALVGLTLADLRGDNVEH